MADGIMNKTGKFLSHRSHAIHEQGMKLEADTNAIAMVINIVENKKKNNIMECFGNSALYSRLQSPASC